MMEQLSFYFWLTVKVTVSLVEWTMETGMSLYSTLPMDPISRGPMAQISVGVGAAFGAALADFVSKASCIGVDKLQGSVKVYATLLPEQRLVFYGSDGHQHVPHAPHGFFRVQQIRLARRRRRRVGFEAGTRRRLPAAANDAHTALHRKSQKVPTSVQQPPINNNKSPPCGTLRIWPTRHTWSFKIKPRKPLRICRK
jgi:hypothetical protein